MAAKSFDSVTLNHNLGIALSHIVHSPSEEDYTLLNTVMTKLLQSDPLITDQELQDPVHVFVMLAQRQYSDAVFRDKTTDSDAFKAIVIFGRAVDIAQKLSEYTMQRFDCVFTLIDYMSLFLMHRDTPKDGSLWELTCDCLSPEVISHFWNQDPIHIDRTDLDSSPETHLCHVFQSLVRLIAERSVVYVGWKRVLDAYPPEAFKMLPFDPNWESDLLAKRTAFTYMMNRFGLQHAIGVENIIPILRYVVDRCFSSGEGTVVLDDYLEVWNCEKRRYTDERIHCDPFYLFLSYTCHTYFMLCSDGNLTNSIDTFRGILGMILDVAAKHIPNFSELVKNKELVYIRSAVHHYTAREIIDAIWPGAFADIIPV